MTKADQILVYVLLTIAFLFLGWHDWRISKLEESLRYGRQCAVGISVLMADGATATTICP